MRYLSGHVFLVLRGVMLDVEPCVPFDVMGEQMVLLKKWGGGFVDGSAADGRGR